MDGPEQTSVSSTQNTCWILIRHLAHISKAYRFVTIASASCCWGSNSNNCKQTRARTHTLKPVKQGKQIQVLNPRGTVPTHTPPGKHINKSHYGRHNIHCLLYQWTDCNILTGIKWTRLCQFLIGLCVLKQKLTQWQSTVCLLLHMKEREREKADLKQKSEGEKENKYQLPYIKRTLTITLKYQIIQGISKKYI